MRVVCGCKRGYQSAYDGKCGHCRTKREKQELEKEFTRLGKLERTRLGFQEILDRELARLRSKP